MGDNPEARQAGPGGASEGRDGSASPLPPDPQYLAVSGASGETAADAAADDANAAAAFEQATADAADTDTAAEADIINFASVVMAHGGGAEGDSDDAEVSVIIDRDSLPGAPREFSEYRDSPSQPAIDEMLSPGTQSWRRLGNNTSRRYSLADSLKSKSDIVSQRMAEAGDIFSSETWLHTSVEQRRTTDGDIWYARSQVETAYLLADESPETQMCIDLGRLNKLSKLVNRGCEIDYVLVSEAEVDDSSSDDGVFSKVLEATDAVRNFVANVGVLSAAEKKSTPMERYMIREMKRADFEFHMIVHEEMKLERIKSRDGKFVYTLVHSPFKKLLHKAEDLHYMAQLDPAFVASKKALGPRYFDFFATKGGRDMRKRYDGVFAPDLTDRIVSYMTFFLPKNAQHTATTLITDGSNAEDVDCDEDMLTRGFDKVTLGPAGGQQTVYYYNKDHGESLWPHQVRAMQMKANNNYYFQAEITRSRVRRKAFKSIEHVDKEDDTNKFFSSGMRSDLTWELIKGNQNEDGNGLEKLIHLGIYNCAFPLHDGELKMPSNEDECVDPSGGARSRMGVVGSDADDNDEEALLASPKPAQAFGDSSSGAAGDPDEVTIKRTPPPHLSQLRTRAALYRVWGKVNSLWTHEGRERLWHPSPFNAIRNYFGSKVALYFVFLDTYTTFLYWPAIVGLLVTLYGLVQLGFNDIYEDEFCRSNHTLCAECSTCFPIKLKNQCAGYKVSKVFDNNITSLFGLFMAIWASTFLIFWKRIRTHYVFRWAVPHDHELHRTRPEFVGRRDWFDQYISNVTESDMARNKPLIQRHNDEEQAWVCSHAFVCSRCGLEKLCEEPIPKTAEFCIRHRCRTVGCPDKVVGTSTETCRSCATVCPRVGGDSDGALIPRISTLNGARVSSVAGNEVGSMTCKRHIKEKTSRRAIKRTSSFSVTVFFVLLAIAFMFSIAIYRLAVRTNIGKNSSESVKPYANLIGMVTASVLDLIAISILNPLYRVIAKHLTDWENHRTVEAYESSLTIKIFCFEFVSTNSAIFYIAFFKGNTDSYPGSYNEYGSGVRDQPCQAYGCNLDLTIQIFVVMLGKQTVQNFFETYLPRLMRYWNVKAEQWFMPKEERVHKHTFVKMPWEVNHLEMDANTQSMLLFDDYLELAIQYGFIAMFVTALPILPFLALSNNLLEMRIDGQNFLKDSRRSTGMPARNIGTWRYIFDALGWFGVLINGAVVSARTEVVKTLVYEGDYENGGISYIDRSFAQSPKEPHECFSMGDFGPNLVNSTSWKDTWAETRGWDCAPCRYNSNREPDGTNGSWSYQVLIGRFVFFVIFEHVVFACKFLAQSVIYDEPRAVKRVARVQAHVDDSISSDEEDDDDSNMKPGGALVPEDASPPPAKNVVRRRSRRTGNTHTLSGGGVGLASPGHDEASFQQKASSPHIARLKVAGRMTEI